MGGFITFPLDSLLLLVSARCLIAAPAPQPPVAHLFALFSALYFYLLPSHSKVCVTRACPASVEMKGMGITENAHKNTQTYLQDTLSGYGIVITAH